MFPHAPVIERIDLLKRLSTLERLNIGLDALLREHGFAFYFFAVDQSLSLVHPALTSLHNLPEDWFRRYLAEQQMHSDPTVRYTREHALPLLWRDAHELITDHHAAQVLAGYREAGLGAACTLPLKAPGGAHCWLTLGCDSDDDASHARLHDFLPFALLLACTVLDCCLRLTRPAAHPETVDLNARERDCLAWASEGMTNAEIGTVLGISDRTAIYHIASACRKLGARNRQHAVTRAMLAGQLGARAPATRTRHSKKREPARSVAASLLRSGDSAAQSSP